VSPSPRVVSAGLLEPPRGLALDEALVRSRPDQPIVAVWSSPPAVVIGRFQRPDWEVDPAACAARGVRVWRRFTGGGAVYLDEGVACVALVVPPGHPAAGLGVPAMYGPFLRSMVRACNLLDVDADADERTVRVGGRKVTGIAAHRGSAATLVHGTLLVDADLDEVQACLAGPRGGDLQGAPRPSPSRPDHVANVGGGIERATAALLEAFAVGTDAGSTDPPAPSAAECDHAERLLGERYSDPGWHAGPWAAVCDPDVTAVLGGRV
jgi:lipoate---protein ligase